MHIAKTRTELRDFLQAQERKVGFVPTMGALHDGHLSLIAASKSRGLCSVASIFVNPTQFNDPKDFEQYPIDTDTDLEKLERAGCELAFLPDKAEVYANGEDAKYIHDFGALERSLEGAFRPGHFRGVGQVVHLLFEAVEPDVAFFGEKDFQQLQVIRRLVEMVQMPIEVVGLPTVRENDGLAMSSRNRRLTTRERSSSTLLFESLVQAKAAFGKLPVSDIKSAVHQGFAENEVLSLEYFEIIHPHNFEPFNDDESVGPAQAVIAAYAGQVRLIDNMALA